MPSHRFSLCEIHALDPNQAVDCEEGFLLLLFGTTLLLIVPFRFLLVCYVMQLTMS